MYSVCIHAKKDVDSILHDTLISTGTEPHDSKIHEELVIAIKIGWKIALTPKLDGFPWMMIFIYIYIYIFT